MKSDQLHRGEERTCIWWAFMSALGVFAPFKKKKSNRYSENVIARLTVWWTLLTEKCLVEYTWIITMQCGWRYICLFDVVKGEEPWQTALANTEELLACVQGQHDDGDQQCKLQVNRWADAPNSIQYRMHINGML